jgi:hypothetical protein
MKPAKPQKADDLFYGIKAQLRLAQDMYQAELEAPSMDVSRYDNVKAREALNLLAALSNVADLANKYRKDSDGT